MAGDSAGGNLSAAVARRTRDDAVRPRLQALIYPATDATCEMESHRTYAEGWFLTKGMMDWYYDHYLGKARAAMRDPDVSPLLAERVDGLCPALVYVAGFDPLRDEGRAYAERLNAAGVAARAHCFDTLIHGFAMMGNFCREARDASRRMAREIGDALRDGVQV